ncbi:MAG: DJ-1/PfpI family protein [Lysobacter sp.]
MRIRSFLSAMSLLLLLPLSAWAANKPRSQPEIRVGIVLFDGVQIIDFAGPYEVFGNAGFGVTTVSADGKPVQTAMGLKVTPDSSFADAPQFDVLLVPGGDVDEAQKNAQILDFIRARSQPARQVLSVCTGAFILGETGLLDGLKATTVTAAINALAKQYPKIQVVTDVRWTDNGKFITSAGLSSGIDAALHVVERLRGEEIARAAALHMEYDWRREHSFVRSKMADRYFPQQLQTTVKWPKGIEFADVISVGDERQWRKRLSVTTTTSADALTRLIAGGVGSIGGWTSEPAASGYRWYSQREGHRVTMTLNTYPATAGGDYELEMAFVVDQPKP